MKDQFRALMRAIIKVPACSGLWAAVLLLVSSQIPGFGNGAAGLLLPPFPSLPQAPAAPAPRLEFVGQWPAETRGHYEDAVAADGFLTVAASSGGVQTFDLRAAAAPARAGELYGLPDPPTSIGRDGARGLVAGFDGWLAALDFSNPAAPAVTWQTHRFLRLAVLAVSGPLAVVAGAADLSGNMRIEVWDLGNPALPVLRGSLTRAQTYTSGNLVFDGTDAYLWVTGTSGGLLHVDVSQPDAPTASLLPDFATGGSHLSLSGDRLLAVGSPWLLLLDVGNPAAPVPLNTNLFAGYSIRSGLLDGTRAYLVGSQIIPSPAPPALDSFHIVDVGNPAAPVPLGSVPLSGDRVTAVRRLGPTTVAVVTARAGVQIFDVTDPAQPRQVSTAGANGHAFRVEPNGTAAYVADASTLRVLDTTTPSAPALLPPVAGLAQGSGRDIARQGTNLVVVGGWGGEVDTFSTADPAAPVSVLRTKTIGPDMGRSVGVLENGFFLVGQGSPWINVFHPAHPHAGSSTLLPAFPALIGRGFVDTNPAVARGSNLTVLGLRTLPSRQSYAVVGDLALPFTPSALAGDKLGRAYLACGTNGLLVADVSAPTQPRLIGTNLTRGPARGVTVRWPYVFVAEGFEGVEVFNATNPTNLVAVAHFDTRGEAESVGLEGGRVYVADGARGVTILRWGYGPLPVPELVEENGARWLRLEFAVASEHAAGTWPQGAPAADGPWTDLPAAAVTQVDGRFVVRTPAGTGVSFLRVRYPAM